MNTTCEKCNAPHKLNLSGITTKQAKYRCQKCGDINVVDISQMTETDRGVSPSSTGGGTTAGSKSGAASSSFHKTNTKPAIPGLSIKHKITIIVVALIISSISIVSFISIEKSSEALSRQAENHMRLATQLKSEQYNAIFSRLSNEIEGVAYYASQTFSRNDISADLGLDVLLPWNGNGYGTLTDAEKHKYTILTLQRIGSAIQGLVKKNAFIFIGYMATEDNLMVSDTNETTELIRKEKGYMPTKRPWYRLAKETGHTVWTQPYIDVTTKKLVVTCATPVYTDTDRLQGVIGFDVFLDTIQSDIITLNIGYDSQAFLVDKKGDFLVKPGMKNTSVEWSKAVESENILKTENNEFKALVVKMLEGKLGVGKYKDGNASLLFSYAPISAIDARVGITASESEVMQPVRETRNLILLVWAFVVIFAIVVGYMIGGTITRPINDLTIRANMISQGDAGLEEIPTTRKDEIGVLIDSFNRMVTSLRIAISRRNR